MADGETLNAPYVDLTDDAPYVDLTDDLDFDLTFDFTNDVNFEMDETVELTNDPDNSTNVDGFEWNFVGFQNEVRGTNDINHNETATEGCPSHKSQSTCESTMSELSEADVMAMKFESEESAHVWYNYYAQGMGFSIRKDALRMTNNVVVSRRWYCSRAGFREQKYLDREERQREARALTRVGCPATLRIKLTTDRTEYEVSNFVKEHNHTLTPPQCVPFLRSHRNVGCPDKAQVRAMRGVGIRPSKIMDYMVQQSGGYEHVGFIRKDLYNYVDAARRKEICNGDAEGALAYLCRMKDSDPMFFYKYDVDEEGSLSRLFWTDGKSILDYGKFGDVLVFDTTYRTNAYRKPFVILAGVNNHWQTTIFGCALLVDEKVETYLWVLATFLEVMKGKTPTSVVTDGDKAMRSAIVQMLPNSHHRLCQWHIQRNAVTNIRIHGFSDKFQAIMKRRCTPQVFEDAWTELLDAFQLHHNKWMRDMYETRSIWAEAYLRGQFFANMTTTQRSEGINSFVKDFAKVRLRLYEFVRTYDMALQRLRNNEAMAHCESDQTEPVLTTHLRDIERHAASIYTRAMFKKVREEIAKENNFFVVDTIHGNGFTNFYLSQYQRPRSRINVLYHPVEGNFQCSCMLFEGMGILCRHAFAVMKVNNINQIPACCILQRWMKTDNDLMKESSSRAGTEAETQNKRLGMLSSTCFEMSYYASRTTEGWNEAWPDVARLHHRMKEMWITRDGGQSSKTPRPVGVRDPKVVETKGSKPTGTNGRTPKRCGLCRYISQIQ